MKKERQRLSESQDNNCVKTFILAKTQALVTAEDDGQVLRCDVIVDRIKKLRIVTKTLELFLEEAPEQFFVR